MGRRRHAETFVVVAGDSTDARLLARISLLSAGFHVAEAGTGQEARAMSRQAQPDCVVLDLRMPDMSSFQLCRALAGPDGLHDPRLERQRSCFG